MNPRSEQSTLTRYGVPAIGLATILLGGFVHGQLTQRWGPGGELQRAAEAIDVFPDEFGPWRLQDSKPMAPIVVETLQCANYVNRVYLNTETAEVVSTAVIVGPPGPTAVHTPEICYSSRDYSILEERTTQVITSGEQEHRFWAVRFRPNRAGANELRVYYAWSAGEPWDATSSPRFVYGGRPYLYKIQLAGNAPVNSEVVGADSCRRFLQDLLASGWGISPEG